MLRTAGSKMAVRSKIAAASAVALVVAGACVSPPPPLPEPFSGGVDPSTAPRATEAAYVGSGPYVAGVTTIEIEPGRKAEVWYPSAPSAAAGRSLDTYYIKDFLSPFLRWFLPATTNPPFETNAYRDITPSTDGPFPLVLFSHGAASYRLQSSFLTTHLATWGFVVVSPDYFERGLQSLLGEPPAPGRPDSVVAMMAISAVRALSAGTGPLAGVAETDRFFPIGHSAGGFTSIGLLPRADVPLAIPMASGIRPEMAPIPAVLGDTSKSIMWIAGRNDGVAQLSGISAGYDYTAGPRAQVIIPGAGHNNAFTDICEIARDEGGIVTLAQNAGLPLPDFVSALGRDGCSAPPNFVGPDVWPITRHFVTAALRDASGLDAEPVGLGSGVVDAFSPAPDTYRHTP